MSSNIMPDEQAIILYLTNISQNQSITYFSGFVAALRDAGKFTARNQDTGMKIQDDSCGNHGSWLGAIGYLALLDQIGGCFKPRNVAQIQGNSINKSLRYFYNTLPLPHVDAIYALRNAFAHDYSLIIHYCPTKIGFKNGATLCSQRLQVKKTLFQNRG